MDTQDVKSIVIRYFNSYLSSNEYKKKAQSLLDKILSSSSLPDIIQFLQIELSSVKPSFIINRSESITYKHLLTELIAICSATKILFYTENSLFKLAIEQFGRETYTPVLAVKSEDSWLRDTLIETKTKIYIRDKKTEALNKAKFQNIEAKEYQTDRLKTEYVTPSIKTKGSLVKESIVCSDEVQIKSSIRCLEGGNFFHVTNTMGKQYLLLGEQVIYYEQKLYREKDDNSNSNSNVVDRTEAEIIQKYAKIFDLPEENVLVIPNVSYHLDLQICYIKRGIFLVNSFYKAFEYFPKQKKVHKDTMLISHKEGKVTEICELLEKHDFCVEKIAGTLYTETPSQDTDNKYQIPLYLISESESESESVNVWLGKGMASSFVNGFDTYSATLGQHYFVTIDSDHAEHKDYFSNILHDYKIKPYFIRANSQDNLKSLFSTEETLKMIDETLGAIRCQTSFISSDKIKDGSFWDRPFTRINLDIDL